MLILALESSAKAASAALLRDSEVVAQYSQCCGLTHSCTLLPMVENMLKNTGTAIKDIDIMAVAHGPGSFTGIRIGVSTLKGLAWASETPCVGVSTLEAMAWHGAMREGLVCPVMDARRSQVYNALFEIVEGKPQRLTPDRAISLEELTAELACNDWKPLLVGDGAKLTAEFFDKAGIEYDMAPANLLYQSAWGVGMAAQQYEAGNADDVLPVYLRLSQAERERQERMASEK